MSGPEIEAQPNTRQRIIESAFRLLAERGASGVTMKAVAESAGVARQTLYNHFDDVESIVTETIEAHQVDSIGALRRVMATIESPIARLEHLVRHAAAGAVQHHGAADMAYSLSAETRAVLRRHDDNVLTLIIDTLQAGIDSGDLRLDIDVERDAVLVKSLLGAVAELAASDPHTVTESVDAATRTLLASVLAR